MCGPLNTTAVNGIVVSDMFFKQLLTDDGQRPIS